ncbi:MAG: FAD-dependent oxidoreductase [Deltaproteobacteria bacterium]|nr:MAG: FAD-dependent oxidoreductase [Deltaproteobacteria bacterium]
MVYAIGAVGVVVALVGFAVFVIGVRAWLLPLPHRRFLGFRPLLAWVVRRRLGEYRVQSIVPDPSSPEQAQRSHRVAVIGGGIAGIAAATTLAERGVSVTLFEGNTYLGGKIGAWPVSFEDGGTAYVEHGFHAFFRHYYNLDRFLRRMGLLEGMRAIEEYVILKTDGSTLGFGGTETTPGLNIVDLALHGVFDWRAIIKDPAASKRMEALLRYDAEKTFERWDDVSFAEFAERARLAPDLALSFTTFSRAFFADPDRMSMAELVKSFHFYYLSHDCGLEYDFPTRNYHTALLEPIRLHLEANGVDIRLGSRVSSIERRDAGYHIGPDWFDEVVLAAHVPGAKAIVRNSPDLQRAAPDLARHMAELQAGQRYAVWRLWLDVDAREGLPMFVITDREELLDSVTFYHRFEPDSAAWVAERGRGCVLELHCYAVPDALDGPEQVKAALLRDLHRFFEELSEATILRDAFQLRDDFPAFHKGLARHRPGVQTGAAGLYLAGDWVRLPFPAMLMEAAFSSGLLAANHILRGLGVREEPVFHVPLQGLLTGLPEGEVPD